MLRTGSYFKASHVIKVGIIFKEFPMLNSDVRGNVVGVVVHRRKRALGKCQ